MFSSLPYPFDCFTIYIINNSGFFLFFFENKKSLLNICILYVYMYIYIDDVHNVRKRLVNKLFILLFCLFIFIKYGDYFIHTHTYICI